MLAHVPMWQWLTCTSCVPHHAHFVLWACAPTSCAATLCALHVLHAQQCTLSLWPANPLAHALADLAGFRHKPC